MLRRLRRFVLGSFLAMIVFVSARTTRLVHVLRHRLPLKTISVPSSGSIAGFVPLSPALPQILLAPTHASCSAAEALNPLWKHAVAASLGTREADLMKACKKLWPTHDRNDIKCKLAVYLADGRNDELVGALHTVSLDKIEAMGPKLPGHRREALQQQALALADTWRGTLSAIADELDSHDRGGALLFALARHIQGARNGQAGLSRQSSQDGNRRGASHEDAVVAWAAERWPEHSVLSNCFIVADADGRPPKSGVKGEFDVLVVSDAEGDDEDGVIVAVVEAKAGPTCYDDVPRMLGARDAFLSAGARVSIRHDVGGHERRLRVRDGMPPEIVYVYGCAGEFAQIASRSVSVALAPALLDKEAEAAARAGDVGAPFEVCDGGREVHVKFDPLRVAQQQAHIEQFLRMVQDLNPSFWGRGPGDGASLRTR